MSTKLPPVPSAAPTSGFGGNIAGPGDVALSSTSVSAVGGTSTPKGRRHPRNQVIGPSLKQEVAVLRAAGMGVPAIAKTLKRSPTTVKAVVAMPAVRATIAELRQTWKQVSQEKVTGLADKTWTLAESCVDAQDSKQLDNTVRALVGMEKISSSISGEGQKVEISGLLQDPPQVELKVLIQQILGTHAVARHHGP